MRKLAFTFSLLLAAYCVADVILKNDGVTVGPVTQVDCALDGGLACNRTSGVARLRCASASSTTPGCVDTGSQSFNGTKTFNDQVAAAGDGLYATRVWTYADGPIDIISTGNSPRTHVRLAANQDDTNINSRIASFGTNYGNTGSAYKERAYVTSIGLERAAKFEQTDAGTIYVGHLSGYLPAIPPTALFDGDVDFAGTKFVMASQFLQLTAMVLVTGYGDGGTNHDAGAVQSLQLEVWNSSTTKSLCEKEIVCNIGTGKITIACALDGGSLALAGAEVFLRAGWNNCTGYPLMNVSAEYGAIQQ